MDMAGVCGFQPFSGGRVDVGDVQHAQSLERCRQPLDRKLPSYDAEAQGVTRREAETGGHGESGDALSGGDQTAADP